MTQQSRLLPALGGVLIFVWTLNALFIVHSIVTVTATAWAIGHLVASLLGVLAGLVAIWRRDWWVWPGLACAGLALYLFDFEGWAVILISPSVARFVEYVVQFPKLAYVGIFMPGFVLAMAAACLGVIALRLMDRR